MEPVVGSLWKARDGRTMRVKEVHGISVLLEVLNATGTMKKNTRMSIANFSDDNWSAFLSPATEV